MLGHYWRTSFFNSLGVNADITITARRWKYVSGVLTYAAESTVHSATGVTTGSYSTGTTQNNSSDLYEGADFVITVTPSGTPTGLVSVEIQRSTDTGTLWPDNGAGDRITGAYYTTSGAKRLQGQVE